MKIIITEEERDFLLSLIGDKNKILTNKLLKTKRLRKRSIYKKCSKQKQENFLLLEEIIRNNFNLTNKEIYKKLGVSKANFYSVYAKKSRELKKFYKSQSLF